MIFIAVAVLLFGVSAQIRPAMGLYSAAVLALCCAPNNAPVEVQLVVSVACCFVLALGLVRASAPHGRLGGAGVAVVALVIVYGVLQLSATVLENSANVFVVAARFTLPAVLAVFAAARLDSAARCFLLDAIVSLAVLQSVIGVLEFLNLTAPIFGTATVYDTALMNPLLPGVVRVQAMLGHPIVLGLLIVFALVLLLNRAPRMRSWQTAGLSAVLLAGLFLCGSRSSWLALAICCVLALFWAVKNLIVRTFAILGLLIGLFAALTSSRASSILVEQLDLFTDSGSFTHRMESFGSFFAILSQHAIRPALIGSGVGSEPRLFAAGLLQQDGFLIIDNQLLTTMVTIGLFGLLVLLSLVAFAVFGLPPAERLACIAMLIMFFTFDALRWTGPIVLFFALVGLVVSYSREKERAKRTLASV
ncbi:hypothetical protein C5B85_16760 [Pseudoclavibacter sp. AY1F1]|nr:hypothetical protein C5B85_16760 [Pseudoclavibacter sp. AY1F1]